MSKARRDADADEEIALVRCKETGRGWIFDKKEAIEDRDEVQSFLGRAEDDGFYVGVGADRRAENRVSGGDSRTIPSEESISLLFEGHEVGVTNEVDGRAKECGDSCSGDRVREGGAVDGLFARAQLEAD